MFTVNLIRLGATLIAWGYQASSTVSDKSCKFLHT